MDHNFIGYFWAPEKYEDKIHHDLHEKQSSIGLEKQENHKIIPPTYFETTDFIYV